MENKNVTEASFSQIDITPEYPTILVGRNRPYPSTGALHRLYAQVLLFRSEKVVFCLIAIDSLGLTVPLAHVIRAEAANLLHTNNAHVMLNFSHTHSAPDPNPFSLNGERYFSFLCNQIKACVLAAKSGFRICKIGWSLGTSEIGENRRKGGTIVDRRLGALMVADALNDEPMALLVRFAAHPNILPEVNRDVSGDFVSIARENLQRFHGFPVMFWQGAAGNIKSAGTNEIGEGNDDILQKVADMIIDSVKQLRFTLADITDIQMLSVEMACFSDIPEKEDAEKMVPDKQNSVYRDWLDACARLREEGTCTQESRIEIHFLKLNEGGFCGIAEEIFCESALALQERVNNPLLFLNGYTNGCTGYLPSRDEWYKGGFEVVDSFFYFHKLTGRVVPYRADTADRIVEMAASKWKSLLTSRAR